MIRIFLLAADDHCAYLECLDYRYYCFAIAASFASSRLGLIRRGAGGRLVHSRAASHSAKPLQGAGEYRRRCS